jgi:acyl-coenzyme A synthetase/AMP-(fatty) acid ligase
MQSANALVAGPTFYPTDICDAVRATPRPRTLVTTPVHLRSLLAAGLDMPQVDLLMSATAPLSAALAAEAEAAFGAPLLEIYGSTETGQIAIRQSARTQEWQLFPGMAFEQASGVTWVSGGHVETPTPMSDVIETLEGGRFLLHGRMADMVNIAGKRNSLAYLNLQLNAVPGVLDGVFAMPDDEAADAGGVARLAAFVVAPGLTAAALTAALRERMDPVFLPRPLVFVDALPRNATGKLPREALVRLAQEASRTRGGGDGA